MVIRLKKIKGQGLVEALIAIAVAGIACLVFLDLAVQNNAQITSTETLDKLAKGASETGQMVKRIVDKDNNRAVDISSYLPDLKDASRIAQKNCYKIVGGLTDPKFESFVPVCTYDTLSACRENAAGATSRSGSETQANPVFNIYCITSLSNNLLIGKVITGLTTCQVLNSTGECKVPDYEYTVVARIKGTYLCGNGVCDLSFGESNSTCAVDCLCGNNVCDSAQGENHGNCQLDCHCGDGACDPNIGETLATCPADCTCGNGKCEPPGETFFTCGGDCKCGNNTCDAGESFATCPGDCKCGNGICDSSSPYKETAVSCLVDCHCGNGVCENNMPFWETSLNCSDDCEIVVEPTPTKCGNDKCETGETSKSCPKDCGSIILPPEKDL